MRLHAYEQLAAIIFTESTSSFWLALELALDALPAVDPLAVDPLVVEPVAVDPDVPVVEPLLGEALT
jgi:hypothetical protein